MKGSELVNILFEHANTHVLTNKSSYNPPIEYGRILRSRDQKGLFEYVQERCGITSTQITPYPHKRQNKHVGKGWEYSKGIIIPRTKTLSDVYDLARELEHVFPSIHEESAKKNWQELKIHEVLAIRAGNTHTYEKEQDLLIVPKKPLLEHLAANEEQFFTTLKKEYETTFSIKTALVRAHGVYIGGWRFNNTGIIGSTFSIETHKDNTKKLFIKDTLMSEQDLLMKLTQFKGDVEATTRLTDAFTAHELDIRMYCTTLSELHKKIEEELREQHH